MSTPSEEISAIQRAGKFLTRLMLDEPRIPKHVRDEARSILRHYPGPTATELFWKREETRAMEAVVEAAKVVHEHYPQEMPDVPLRGKVLVLRSALAALRGAEVKP